MKPTKSIFNKLFAIICLFVVVFSLIPTKADAYGGIYQAYYNQLSNQSYKNEPGFGVVKPEPVGAIDCNFSAIVTPMREFKIEDCIAEGLYTMVLKPASWVLWLAGVVFNVTLNFTLNFGSIINDPAFGLGSDNGAIYIGWSTIRNFINVSFIFILLYVSIATILDNGYSAKKMIIKVVIAALLLNFSLFFTKVIIDLSNVIALQFYSRIIEAASKASGATGAEQATKADGGLSAGYLNALGLKTLWGGADKPGDSINSIGGGLTAYQLILICIGGSIFMIIFAFVLIMATVQFMLRSIVLIILMITSAVGFLQGSVPGIDAAAKDWWSQLKSNAVFAPVYMALLYMVSQIIFGAKNSAFIGQSGFVGVIKGEASSVGLIFWFILVIGLLIGVQIVAGRFASKFGSGITKGVSGKIKGFGKWTGGKALAGATAIPKAAAGGASRAILRTDAGGRVAGAATTTLRRLGFKDAATNLADKRVDAAKESAKNLRRKEGEDDKAYKIRQSAITNRAQEAAWKNAGLDASHMQYDRETREVSLSQIGKDRVKQMRREAQQKFGSGRRKAAKDRLDKTFGNEKPKKGTTEEAETKLDNLKAKRDTETNNATYKPILTQYQADLARAEAAIATSVSAGTTINARDIAALAAAKKKLAQHTSKVDKLEEEVEKQERAVEDAKRREKEDKDKEKEKKKKK